MGAPSKRARKIRYAPEFNLARLLTSIAAPRETSSAYAWDLPQIMAARDAQMRGDFRLPARLAESFRTDSALSVALRNRLAPQKCIRVELCAAKGSIGEKIASEAEGQFGPSGVAITPEALADVNGHLANHDVAFAYNVPKLRPDGSRIDFEVHPFPIEHVRWDPHARCFKARLEGGFEEPICHGDGRWIVFAKHEIEPFKHGALLSAALVWARHAFGLRDWSKSSVSHGMAKAVGELPQGVALQDENGNTTPEAQAMLDFLIALATGDLPVGLKPAGSKAEFIANSGTMWQVFKELVDNAEKAAARIYLGTDGTLGASGGAPGVDISELFGVATTIVQGDIECIERCLHTGAIEPWTAINFGDSKLAPRRRYLMPDPDADAARASLATRTTAFYDEIDRAKASGFVVSQAFVDEIAEKHGVKAPTLAPATAPAPAA